MRKLPKPRNSIFSPVFSVSTMLSKTVFTTISACFFGRPVFSETSSTSSALVMPPLDNSTSLTSAPARARPGRSTLLRALSGCGLLRRALLRRTVLRRTVLRRDVLVLSHRGLPRGRRLLLALFLGALELGDLLLGWLRHAAHGEAHLALAVLDAQDARPHPVAGAEEVLEA